MFMVGLSVSLSVVGHADVLWQNGWIDRDAVWHVGCCGLTVPVVSLQRRMDLWDDDAAICQINLTSC